MMAQSAQSRRSEKTAMHLAQLNVGRLRYPIDHPALAEFKSNLDRVNAMADRSPGFVWRLKGDNNNAIEFRIGDDLNVNMSVWETPKALEDYVFKTVHASFYRKRTQWFEILSVPHMVFWWVEEGHLPILVEAKERLDHYTQNGATDFAFGWAEVIDIERW